MDGGNGRNGRSGAVDGMGGVVLGQGWDGMGWGCMLG